MLKRCRNPFDGKQNLQDLNNILHNVCVCVCVNSVSQNAEEGERGSERVSEIKALVWYLAKMLEVFSASVKVSVWVDDDAHLLLHCR